MLSLIALLERSNCTKVYINIFRLITRHVKKKFARIWRWIRYSFSLNIIYCIIIHININIKQTYTARGSNHKLLVNHTGILYYIEIKISHLIISYVTLLKESLIR